MAKQNIGDYVRMSPRMPANADWRGGDLHVNQAAMEADPAFFGRAMDRARRMPNLTHDERAGDDHAVAAHLKEHIRRNLLYIYHKIPEEQRRHTRHWYAGAHRMIRERAAEHGVPLQSAAGAYAALSPQKDWLMNASLGDRILDMVTNRRGEKFSPAMLKTAERLFAPSGKPGDEAKDARYAALVERLNADRRPFGARLQDLSSQLRGGKATKQDIEDAGAWARIFDETNHRPDHAVLNPYGDMLDFATNKSGTRKKVAWGKNLESGRSVASAVSGGHPTIVRPLMGEGHKVPSFANNMGDPWHEAGDVTVDTHAIAAALMRPLSGEHPDTIALMRGRPNSDPHGIGGLYGLAADAYRDVARELGLSPRELQSVVWEGARGLFPKDWKDYREKPKGPKTHFEHVENLWRNRGERSQRHIQDEIHTYAAGIAPPDWWGLEQRPGMHWRHYLK